MLYRFLVFSSAVVVCIATTSCTTIPATEADVANTRGIVVSAGCRTTGSHIRRRECDEAVETLSRQDVENRLHDAEPQKPDPSRPLN
jgi:hypothetical protein